ncbi:MAG: von Willebrand factor type (vWA) domain protein-like protein, partial [Deltaproteobacteria bacterium]|nr:von Willebrand factor type (vWA) domain protein-like protein [Deltaproteobacteria bacterium]
MIGYRYFTGHDASPMEGAGADEVLDRLSDLLLHENDINKSLDLLKQQGIKGEDGNQSLQGIHDFLEQVRRMKQKLQETASSGDPKAIEELKRLEKLEHELRRASWGLDLEKINAQEIRDLMGEQSYQLWNQLKALPRVLEANQLIEKLGDKYVLTPKGMRKIGQRALRDIFASLNRDALGSHETQLRGNGIISLLEESRPYQFGDPFHLNLAQTLLNSVTRQAFSDRWSEETRRLQLHPNDFEVYQTEKRTRSAVVLMLDMSGSMARDEKFFAAKKVALALHTLIQTQFPHDKLKIVGFSSYARPLKEK